MILKPDFDRAKVARHILRFMVGAAMIGLWLTLNDTAVIPAYVEMRTRLTLDMLRGMLFFGGVGLWVAPTRNPVALFYLTLPLFIYAAGGVGGALDDRFQDWTGIIYLLLCGMFIVLYWRDSS